MLYNYILFFPILFKFLIPVHLIHYIKKYCLGIIGLCSLVLVLIFRLENKLKSDINSSKEIFSPLNYANESIINSGYGDILLFKSQEMIYFICNVATNNFFAFCVIGGILLGIFLFVFLVFIISSINSISLIYKYNNSKDKIDEPQLLNIIQDLLNKKKQSNYIDLDENEKLLLIHLYKLKIIR